MPCAYHDRIYFCAVHLFTLPIKTRIIFPCCNTPRHAEQFFRREHFLDGHSFSLEKYRNALALHCTKEHCPNYKEGDSIVSEVAIGEWRKCPGKCITCFNSVEDNSRERPLSPDELAKYLDEVCAVYADIRDANEAQDADAPVLRIGAAGDLFFSENYRGILAMDLTARGVGKLGIITNFQTWTERAIAGIHPNTRRIMKEIVFSIDSTEPALYEALRAGSKWERLLAGYRLATEAFPDAAYKVSYTVSKVNFHEVPAVPRRIKELFPAVSALEFHAVQDWIGTPAAASLILSPEERENLIAWAGQQGSVDEMAVKFLY